MSTVAITLTIITFLQTVTAFVIAPPWANGASNPCAQRSWQLIYWPKDGQCYQIFEQGPCPRSQELAFNEVNKRAECRCPKDLLYWPATDRCYPEFGKGPCELSQYLERDMSSKRANCRSMERCDNGWIFWPSEGKCFELYTQGPCHKGDLLIMNPLTAEPYCGCDPLLLRQYYFPPLKLCYEHFTRGPCEAGLLFAYNHTSASTHCMCTGRLSNYHEESRRCFQFGQKGPCRKGQVFAPNPSNPNGRGECACKDNYVLWPSNGECYKAFTPGPCNAAEFIVPDDVRDDVDEEKTSTEIAIQDSGSSASSSRIGVCVQNPCPRAHLYFPSPTTSLTSPASTSEASFSEDAPSVQCHKVGSRGPCPLGKLVVFEKYSGKSFRGECGCSPGYNQNYWPDTGKCYEWYSQGPCQDSFLFQYNKDSGRTECVCDSHEGYVFWNETGQCYRVYSQGPCPANAWLIPGEGEDTEGNLDTEVFCECKAGYYFDQDTYTCQQSKVPLQLPYTNANKWAQRLLAASAASGNRWRRPGAPLTSTQNPVQWSQGVFVTPGGEAGGIDRRNDNGGNAPGAQPDYSWIASQWEERAAAGWGAKALPRVARARAFAGGSVATQPPRRKSGSDWAPKRLQRRRLRRRGRRRNF